MATVESSSEKSEDTRRSFGRKVIVGGTVLFLPATAEVVRGDTDSGFVELETDAAIPPDTNIDVTLFEDTDGDGTADRQQTESIPDGTDITTYDALSSFVGQGHILWMDIQLSQDTDGEETPQLSSATITLPDDEPEEPEETEEVEPEPSQGLAELWDNPLVFISTTILAVTGIGMASKSLAVAAWGGYMTFAAFAITTGYPLLENILYVTLVLIFVGFAFKFWRLEGMGE